MRTTSITACCAQLLLLACSEAGGNSSQTGDITVLPMAGTGAGQMPVDQPITPGGPTGDDPATGDGEMPADTPPVEPADGPPMQPADDVPPADGMPPADDEPPVEVELEPFSFFVTSMEAIQRLSGNADGFGGDLRYGEGTGLAGADKICTEIAEASMPGSASKQWRAFLSTTTGGEGGGPVHAIERIGEGPWYDRVGRLVAMDRDALLNDRPQGADPAIINDLPNEFGIPNKAPDGMMEVDNHHTLTGSGTDGRLYQDDPRVTCQDWTSAEGSAGQPRTGFSWPREGFGGFGMMGGGSSSNWISGYSPPGCAAHINIVQTGPPPPGTEGVGSGGGYGGFYCFALSP